MSISEDTHWTRSLMSAVAAAREMDMPRSCSAASRVSTRPSTQLGFVVIVCLPLGLAVRQLRARPGRRVGAVALHRRADSHPPRCDLFALDYVPRRTCARHHPYLDWHRRLTSPAAEGPRSTTKAPTTDAHIRTCLLYTSPSPRDGLLPR